MVERKAQRPVRRPHCIEQVATVQDHVGTDLQHPVDESLERQVGIDLPLVQPLVRAVLVADLAVGRETDMGVRDMDDLQDRTPVNGRVNAASHF